MILVTGGTGTVGREMLPVLGQLMRGEPVHLLRRPTADLCQPGLGLSEETRRELQRQVRVIVHCAAEIRFNLPLDEVRQTNLEGTRRMLEFARGCPRLDRFAHVSTLYIAGRREGWVREQPLAHNEGYFNTYTQSKHEAEALVLAETNLPVSIHRLSSVLGGGGHVEQVLRLIPFSSEIPILPGKPEVPVDLVSAEWTGRALALLIARHFTPGAIRHICAGPELAPTFGELMDVAFAGGGRRPRLVSASKFEWALKAVSERSTGWRAMMGLATFLPHLSVAQPFDPGATGELLASAGMRPVHGRDLMTAALSAMV
jgi:nucleoside-diphosphate-sugar epimerase